MASSKPNRVLVTGGSTYLGMSIAAALLAEGAEVTLLVRPDTESRLGALAQRVRWFPADMWNPASLRGRARGHHTVIHTVGSMVAEPAQGLTFHQLNVVSARNAMTMCVSDGVPHMILMSASRAPWINAQYIRAKREAEQYVKRVGLEATIVRAPLTYIRGEPRPLFYRLMTLLGSVPPVSWLGFNTFAPMPLDILARGVARIATSPNRTKRVYAAPDLRRLNKREERRGLPHTLQPLDDATTDVPPRMTDLIDEDAPFGWVPPKK
jgi:uncharacterized protein YbjT (DUF2867 family)